MTARSTHNGRKIEFIDNVWVYSNTKNPIETEIKFEPDKFIVINRKNLEQLTWYYRELMEAIQDQVSNDNKYYVCNQDEPYAEEVLKVILEGEREKAENTGSSFFITPESIKSGLACSKSLQAFFDHVPAGFDLDEFKILTLIEIIKLSETTIFTQDELGAFFWRGHK